MLRGTTANSSEGSKTINKEGCRVSLPAVLKNKSCLEMSLNYMTSQDSISLRFHVTSWVCIASFGKLGPSVIEHLKELGIYYLRINSEGRSGDSTISNHFGKWSFDYYPADAIRKRSLNSIFVHIRVLSISVYKGL